MSIDYQVFRMTARIFLIKCLGGATVWDRNVMREIFAREDSGLFLPEFDYRRDEPFQERFAADGHRTVKFFD
jgi:hypothetical protein